MLRLFLCLSCCLLSLSSTKLRCWCLLDWLLRLANSTGAGNGVGAEITSVSWLGDVAGNSLVGPFQILLELLWLRFPKFKTHFLEVLFGPKVVLLDATGFCAFPCFLVIRVTPPFSPGTTPTACPSISTLPLQYATCHLYMSLRTLSLTNPACCFKN